jgi:cytochrome b6-f complex iron-sulfur subunit
MKKQNIKKKEVVVKKSEVQQSEVKPQPAISDAESRRQFLQKLWKGLGIVASIEVAAVFFGFLFSGKKDEQKIKPKQLIEAGNVESFKKNSVTAFRGGRFYLARLLDGGFIAVSLRCTHLGCSINWEEDKNRFICPCHSSAFYINGEVQNPPAPNALDYFPVFIENGIVKVDVGTKLQRSRFEKSQVTYV